MKVLFKASEFWRIRAYWKMTFNKDRSAVEGSLVSYPTRYSWLLIFGFLFWSFHILNPRQQRNIVKQCARGLWHKNLPTSKPIHPRRISWIHYFEECFTDLKSGLIGNFWWKRLMQCSGYGKYVRIFNSSTTTKL